MSEIKWLHISDLHFNGNIRRDPYEVNKVLEPLLNTIEERKPDLIFVTGDIGKAGKKEDYDLALKFFRELLERAKLRPERLWIVPGNHDVDREVGRFLQRTLDSEKDSQIFFGNPKNREAYIEKFGNYVNFLERLFPKRQVAEGDAVHQPAVVKIKNFPIGILPLNSAWFSQDDFDAGKLWIGVRTAKERFEQLKGQKPLPKLIIAPLHHPFSYLHEESEAAKSWIRNRCQVVLRGHLHQTDVESVCSLTGDTLEIAAGATYQGSDKPCRAFFAIFNTERRSILLDPLQYIDKPHVNTWIIDPSVFPKPPSYTEEYSMLFQRIRGGIQPKPPIAFPFDDWRDVNRVEWMDSIVKWFNEAYKKNPNNSMKHLLDHVFEIINNIQPDSHIHQRIINLGEALLPSLLEDLPSEQQHHQVILKLFKLGIHRNLPHLFMLPQVDKNNLLEVPEYSQLLLSARYLAAGYYKDAQDLAKPISRGCFIALYILGQSARKMEFLHEAKLWLEENMNLLQNFEKHVCPFSRRFEVICDKNLLRAENYRALGVVCRRLEEKEEAQKHFEEATKAAETAIDSIRSRSLYPLQTTKDVIIATYDMMPLRVISDVHYSHGYYWYEQKEFEKAENLFELSIKAIEDIGEEWEWDAPYSRLAIIKLLSGQEIESGFFFLKARQICQYTDPAKNRESSLGLSLCTLGLKVMESITKQSLIKADAINDLENALQLQPPLLLGPLICHLHDVENIAPKSSPQTTQTVSKFITRLKSEIESLNK